MLPYKIKAQISVKTIPAKVISPDGEVLRPIVILLRR